ncbi:hypothetical protein [Nesterenkonia sp. PF2B19]|uniref:hypothetical protein n=1 Tax=Nesterenkonia sp. PF2B19 TaxID=1881858 RepID=UPI000871E22E|nr:hypothetical protein [Nesterenkonia sp. PF2B19]OSM43478.1 hypothetical protein BCY76_008140 [Nesterenkonia sp. PF2B19]
MTTIPGNRHAADAEYSTEALREWMESEGETDATMLAVALDSQAQATLALAHEQRTANLIALLNTEGRCGIGAYYLREEIRERMGKNHA